MRFNGLSQSEVAARRAQFGLNVLPEEKRASGLKIFLSQFVNPLVYILIFVGLVSLFLAELRDAIFIFLTVVLNSVFGFIQEYKAQKTLVALQRLVRPMAKVVRGGERQDVEASGLVPGDIVVLAVGDRVPADGVAVEAASFFVNEAILTGESEPVEKRVQEEAYMGTIVSWGSGLLRVERIGAATKVGEIARSLQETVQPPTTLQVRLKAYIRTLIVVAASFSFLVFILGQVVGLGSWEMLRISLVLLIAMMPEALLLAVTLILAIGMRQILKRRALIRKLLAVETLGAVTTICTDKTGTLTEGKMRVSRVEFLDRTAALDVMCLCNNQSDATEIALWDYLEGQTDYAARRVADDNRRLLEIPFSSEHKFMATADCAEADCHLHVKGAPEVVLKLTDLPPAAQAEALARVEAWGREGLRVLALARRPVSRQSVGSMGLRSLPHLKFVGLVGLWDAPRPEAKEALAAARKAGLKVKIVTGDYRHTAEKVAEFLGLPVGPDGLLEGREIELLDDEALRRRVAAATLFTRVTPQQKLRVVRALQALGEVVTMTGDGVNDAPALKQSNIGIVVGTATEVAKETADLILLDSNFKTIVAAVEEGRTVFDNIRKAIFYMLANSFSAALVVAASFLFGWPLPLTVAQILWIHLICDGPQDITLGLEPREPELLAEGPKSLAEPILDRLRLLLIFCTSFLSAAFALLLFWDYGLRLGDLELGRTMAFMAATLGSILFIIPSRSFRKPFWRYSGFWRNPWLLAAVGINLALQVGVTYWPVTRHLMRLKPLGASHWLLLLAGVTAIIMFIELMKRLGSGRLQNQRTAA